jgi:hypothetical protein
MRKWLVLTVVAVALAVLGISLFLAGREVAVGLSGPPMAVTGPRASTLRPSGPLTISNPGAVLVGLEIAGDVIVDAPGVTIRDCRILGRVIVRRDGDRTGATLRIEDSELDGRSLPATKSAHLAALGVSHITARRLEIHGFGKALQIEGDDVLLENSWLHGLTYDGRSHNDAIYTGGGRNIVIRGNLIDASGPHEHITGAVVLLGDLSPISQVTVERNVLTGGGYTVYAGSAPGKPFPQPQSLRFSNNAFTRDAYPNGGFYGPVTGFDPVVGNVWEGNFWYGSADEVPAAQCVSDC